MAAIISQLAANKRARAKRIKNTIPIEKSVYFLPPFDPAFDPCLHNKYMKAVRSRQEQLQQQILYQQHQQQLLLQQQSITYKNIIKVGMRKQVVSSVLFPLIFLFFLHLKLYPMLPAVSFLYSCDVIVSYGKSVTFWCNGPLKGCSHGLQVEVGTSGKNEDDDASSSD